MTLMTQDTCTRS